MIILVHSNLKLLEATRTGKGAGWVVNNRYKGPTRQDLNPQRRVVRGVAKLLLAVGWQSYVLRTDTEKPRGSAPSSATLSAIICSQAGVNYTVTYLFSVGVNVA
jgi:hypothetical protein